MAVIRMTNEQKRDIIHNMLLRTKEFFKRGEIENYAVKQGVAFNTIKGIIEELVIDGLVDKDRIGAHTIYWALPSKMGQKIIVKADSLKEEHQKMVEAIKAKKQQIIEITESKEMGEERSKLENEYYKAVEKNKKQLKVLKEYENCNPEVYDRMCAENAKMIKECNKIIDDIFTVQDYVCKKFGADKNEFNRNFSIPEDFDYIQHDTL